VSEGSYPDFLQPPEIYPSTLVKPHHIAALRSVRESPVARLLSHAGGFRLQCGSRSYENRKFHDREFSAAAENGEVQVLTVEKLRERAEASKAKTPAPVDSLRVPEADLAMSRRQAEQKGLPYQTYIKSILHETLAGMSAAVRDWGPGRPVTICRPRSDSRFRTPLRSR
jgi:predicted DNA binding CopG/RHH family protein